MLATFGSIGQECVAGELEYPAGNDWAEMTEDHEEVPRPMGWKEWGLWISTGTAIIGVAISFIGSLSIGLGLFALSGAAYFMLSRIRDQ